MKAIFKDYQLDTTGKMFNIDLLALFRAVGVGGELAMSEINGENVELFVGFALANGGGIRQITTTEKDGCVYSLDGSTMSLRVASLEPGYNRLFVTAKYGTNEMTLLNIRMHVPDEVRMFLADGVYTPLVRTPELDHEAVAAYTYPYGDVVVWIEGELHTYGKTTAKVFDGIEDADYDQATEEVGMIVVNPRVVVYDEESDIELPVQNAFVQVAVADVVIDAAGEGVTDLASALAAIHGKTLEELELSFDEVGAAFNGAHGLVLKDGAKGYAFNRLEVEYGEDGAEVYTFIYTDADMSSYTIAIDAEGVEVSPEPEPEPEQNPEPGAQA